MNTFARKLLPRSLFGRLMLILVCGLISAQALSFGLVMIERTIASRTMMFNYLTKDIASSVAILERLPAAERPSWLERLARDNYRYALQQPQHIDAHVSASVLTVQLVPGIAAALGGRNVQATQSSDGHLLLATRLADGAPLTIDIRPNAMPLSASLVLSLLLQLTLLCACSWLAVRVATRPLAQLADAADRLGPALQEARLPEDGPQEVARAATAFNAMQRRIGGYLTERMQILAAVSHDLQTPITRMRLRADLLDDAIQRQKMLDDLMAMEALVREGIAYARSTHAETEPVCRIDPDALIASIVGDYRDSGQQLALHGSFDMPIVTRPHALRRVVTNLLDNAFKFGANVELAVGIDARRTALISVRDRGPGIAAAELQNVLQPFYRLENSRNRDTGGTGLGLAIAHKLTEALGGTLRLSNRAGGGLEVRVSLPVAEDVPGSSRHA